MNILGILGSPRRGGNSECLLDKALEGAKDSGADVEKIILNELSFRPCQECGGCDKTGLCVIHDDMQIVYQKVDEADGVVLCLPIFFGSLSAQTKMMIDRFQCSWVAKYRLKHSIVRKRQGVFIAVEASNRQDFFDNAKSIIKNFLATVGINYDGEVFCSGLEGRADVLKRADCLEKAYGVGREIQKSNIKMPLEIASDFRDSSPGNSLPRDS